MSSNNRQQSELYVEQAIRDLPLWVGNVDEMLVVIDGDSMTLLDLAEHQVYHLQLSAQAANRAFATYLDKKNRRESLRARIEELSQALSKRDIKFEARRGGLNQFDSIDVEIRDRIVVRVEYREITIDFELEKQQESGVFQALGSVAKWVGEPTKKSSSVKVDQLTLSSVASDSLSAVDEDLRFRLRQTEADFSESQREVRQLQLELAQLKAENAELRNRGRGRSPKASLCTAGRKNLRL